MMSSHRIIFSFVLAAAVLCAAGGVVWAQAGSTADPRGERPQAAPDPQPLALSFADSADQPQGGQASETKTEAATIEPEPILWKGFLYGDQHFRDKPRPVGSPLYFEDPFINTDVRFVFLWNEFPEQSQLRGGQLTVYALPIRIAITDRLQFLAYKDGYSHLESPILDDDSGWNDLGVGLKYALLVDHENDFLLSSGLKWNLSNGHAKTLQGNVEELSPFVSAYKGWDKWNFLANVAGRIPMDEHQGNCILSWDGHVDYEVFKNFFPLFEVHGLHYLSNGDRLPLDVGGLDYGNIGSAYVAGHAAFWGGVGFRWNIVEHVSWGAVWEFPMQTTSNNDLFEQRVTTNLILTF
jgi:hypothetical protein